MGWFGKEETFYENRGQALHTARLVRFLAEKGRKGHGGCFSWAEEAHVREAESVWEVWQGMQLGRNAGARSCGALTGQGRRLDFNLDLMRWGFTGRCLQALFSSCGVKNRQDRNRVEETPITNPDRNIWGSHRFYQCKSSQITVDMMRITLYTLTISSRKSSLNQFKDLKTLI